LSEHIREAEEQIQHASVVGEHVGSEAADTAGLGRLQEIGEEDGAEPPVLPAVLNDERELSRIVPIGRLVPRHGDEFFRLVLDDQGEPPTIVHVGEEVSPVRRQSLHQGEEALVCGLAAQPLVEFHESGSVLRPDGSDREPRPVAQDDLVRQLARIGHRRDSGHSLRHCSGIGAEATTP
jgi:hypothetical protein